MNEKIKLSLSDLFSKVNWDLGERISAEIDKVEGVTPLEITITLSMLMSTFILNFFKEVDNSDEKVMETNEMVSEFSNAVLSFLMETNKKKQRKENTIKMN